MKGKVRFFNETKGWGFIDPDDGSKSLFVHYSDIEGSGFRILNEGDAVEFESVDTPRGPKAQKVKRLNP